MTALEKAQEQLALIIAARVMLDEARRMLSAATYVIDTLDGSQ